MEDIEVLLKKIEEIIGYTLPKDFKNFYLNHLKMDNIEFLDLEHIYFEVQDVIEDKCEPDSYTIEPEKTILPKTFSKKRVPFIYIDTGDYIGIDFEPDVNGTVGQIINYGCNEYDMKVFAYNFKEFVEGIKNINFGEEYITDYLFRNNIDFRNNKIEDKSIVKIEEKEQEKEEITKKVVNENIVKSNIEIKDLQTIIDILSQMNRNIVNDTNIKTFKNIWFDHRIINKRESLSRTMPDQISFYKKLEESNKEEIKGFSFAVLNKIEESRKKLLKEKIVFGEEKIFVEINIIKKQTLVRYTKTIENKYMKKAYEEINDFLNTKRI